MLAARGVTRRYGRHVALAPVDLDVRAGTSMALIGPNGAGKSTLLAILAGALLPTAGRVERSETVSKVGWVPQRPAQYGRLSPRENLELFARLEGLEDPKSATERMLGLVELPDDDRTASELSVGNQQRLNLAIALLGGPDVLLLDEPSAALDPRQRRRLWELASEVRSHQGAVVFVTQNLEELEHFADLVVVLQDGEIAFSGPYADYTATPEAHLFQ
jgi:ABC-type multidrug transport system ATPase subunit